MSLREYLDQFHRTVGRIDDYGFAESIDIKEEIRAAKQAAINAKIVLVDGSVLHIREYIDAKYKIERINETFEKRLILFKFKEEKNFNHRNTLSILRIKI